MLLFLVLVAHKMVGPQTPTQILTTLPLLCVVDYLLWLGSVWNLEQ